MNLPFISRKKADRLAQESYDEGFADARETLGTSCDLMPDGAVSATTLPEDYYGGEKLTVDQEAESPYEPADEKSDVQQAVQAAAEEYEDAVESGGDELLVVIVEDEIILPHDHPLIRNFTDQLAGTEAAVSIRVRGVLSYDPTVAAAEDKLIESMKPYASRLVLESHGADFSDDGDDGYAAHYPRD